MVAAEKATRDPALPFEDIWAHELAALETGACLVSEKNVQWPPSRAHLEQAVILVTAMDSQGISGLMLTFPTTWTVGKNESVLGRVGKQFANNVVYLGGACEGGTLEVLHGLTELEASGAATMVIDGLFKGGLNGCRELVKVGRIRPEEIWILVGYTRWSWEEWKTEFSSGRWRVVACSERLLLSHRRGLWHKINSLID